MALAQPAAGWRSLVEREISAFGLVLRDAAAFHARAALFLERVVTWNQRIDLTSAREPEELVDLLFADAAAIAAAGFVQPGERWLDVGTGMGAPGVALGLFEPGIDITLVEPRAKRVAFLRPLVASLGHAGMRVSRQRSDALPGRCVDVAIARATLPPAQWLAEGLRLATRAVWVLVAREAPPEAAGAILSTDLSFEWPLTGRARRALRYQPAG